MTILLFYGHFLGACKSHFTIDCVMNNNFGLIKWSSNYNESPNISMDSFILSLFFWWKFQWAFVELQTSYTKCTRAKDTMKENTKSFLLSAVHKLATGTSQYVDRNKSFCIAFYVYCSLLSVSVSIGLEFLQSLATRMHGAAKKEKLKR